MSSEERPSKPPACDKDVFLHGEPLLAADTGDVGGNFPFEEWVKAVAQESGQRVDWHYSGGRAQVLFIGDRARVEDAAKAIPCPAYILRWLRGGEGLWRNFEGVES